jgi:hypothetical protein
MAVDGDPQHFAFHPSVEAFGHAVIRYVSLGASFVLLFCK